MNNFFNVVGNWMLMIGVFLCGASLVCFGVSIILITWGGGTNNSATMALDITVTLLAAGVPLWIVGSFIAEVTD